jgi:hypothetical protein
MTILPIQGRFHVRHLTSIACALTLSVFALHAQSGGPPSRVARISALVGQASLQPSDANEWSEAALNYTVTTGDRLYTSKGSRVELEIGPMSLRISENADVTVTNLTDGFLQLGVAQGTLRLSVYRLARGDSIEVDTPNGAVIVTTPGEYRIDVPENDRFTIVSVSAGNLDVIGPGLYQDLGRGQAVQLSGTDPIRAVSIPAPPPTSFDQWGADRDRRVSIAECSRYMSRDIPGCADLDDAGRWEPNAEYGHVWFPSRVSADWVPYRDGRWVWVEPWGWSWVADEPWGYAPSHYGRWARFGPSWGWIPGPMEARPYYAPALVAFVGGPGWSLGAGIGSQAWFPLGPREAYIPSYHHNDAYLRQVNITNIRNVTNINVIIEAQNTGRGDYVNRRAGMTAVSTDAFRNGRPVSKEVVRVRPEEIDRGSIIAHPSAAPVLRAVLRGLPATMPPVAARPRVILTPPQRSDPPVRGGDNRGGDSRGGANRGGDNRGGDNRGGDNRGMQQQRGGAQLPPPTVVTKTPPPSIAVPPIPPAPKRADVPPDQSRGNRPIITRTPPPPQSPPFKAKEEALKAQPGKPLEPQQIQNVRAGRAAGPPQDKVIPPQKIAPTPPPKSQVPPPTGRGRGDKQDSTGRGRGGRGGT